MEYYGYRFIRESDLAHHGILGMKWGIRRFQNKDGTLTSAGKKRYLSADQVSGVREVIKGSKYNEDISDQVFSIVGADKSALYAARAELQKNLEREREVTKEFDEMFKGLDTDEGARTYYMAVSEMANFGSWKSMDDITLADMADAAWMGVYEDGGQGKINEYSMFAYKNGLEDKCDSLLREHLDASKASRAAAESYIQTSLDSVGAGELAAYERNPNYSVAKAMVQQMVNADYDSWKDTHGGYLLNSAADSKLFTSADKSDIAKAEAFASNLKNNRDSSRAFKNTWALLREATDNLGLSDEKASELSKADWARINAEIDRLKAGNVAKYGSNPSIPTYYLK